MASNSKDFSEKNLEVNPSDENNGNESEMACDNVDDIFTMDDLSQRKESNHGAQIMVTDLSNDVSGQPPKQSTDLVESLSISHLTKVDIIQSDNSSENSIGLVKQREELGVGEMHGVKRPLKVCNNMESSVRVLYSSLPSRSIRKLEELLHNWSEWHAKNCASMEDPVDSLESGEETYFPALHVGSDKPSTVSFAMDVHLRKRQRKESSDNGCSSMYDRGYAIGLASDEGINDERSGDLREAPRCFNCGSYGHPLSECSKPRDNAAVNSARKQFLSKKSQTGPRIPTRYYQESPGGKFDGLKPGALSAETRELLGLGELDPLPWLNRMRELGYPPGYLDQEEEDEPSGITIFGDEETHNAALGNDLPFDAQNFQKKKTVDFPGINAPIPKNADQWRWLAPPSRGPPGSDISWNQFDNRQHYPPDSLNNGRFHGAFRPRNHIQAPPYHVGLGSSPPVSNYPYPSGPFSPRGIPIPGNPNYGRSPDTRRPFLHQNYGSF